MSNEVRMEARQASKSEALRAYEVRVAAGEDTRVVAVRLTHAEVAALEALQERLTKEGVRPDRKGWSRITISDAIRHCVRRVVDHQDNTQR